MNDKNKAQLVKLTGEPSGREQKNFKTISSREVAEMMGVVRHSDMLEKIDRIDEILQNGNIRSDDYWFQGSYIAGTGKSYREYQVTKKGCELIAHKTEGEKGVLFTVKYMERFEQLEQEVKQPRKLSALEQIQLIAQGTMELEERVDRVVKDFQDFQHDLPLLGCDMDRITTAVKKMGVECLGGKDTPAYQDKSLRGKVYSDIYDQLKRQFGVSTYKSIKRSQCDTAVSIVHNYQLPMVLLDEITDANAQMSL